MSEAKESGHEAGADAKKPKGKKKLIVILAVVLLLGGGAGGFFMLGGKKEAVEEEVHEEKKHYSIAKLDTFIVNLAQSGSFLKVTMQIEYDPEAATKGEAAGGGHGSGGGEGGGLPGILGEKEPVIRDAVIRILSSKKGEEVLTSDGKDTLKQELVDGLNEALGTEEPVIVNVYFSEFIIQ